jgi:hypothetical protein
MDALLHSWVRRGIHQIRTAGPFAVVAASGILACSLVAIWDAGVRFWAPHLLEDDLFAWIRLSSFWLVAITALVQGWTTFEAIYRHEETRFLHPLAPDPRQWHRHTLRRIRVVHAFGLLPALLFTMPVFLQPSGLLTASAAALVVVPLLWGTLLGTTLHLRAGEESLLPAGRLKESLAGGAIRPEAALLFLSPSGAFASALLVSVALEFALRFGVERGVWGPTIAMGVALLLAAAWALRAGQRVFRDSFHRVLPRFIELEHVPPFRELDKPTPAWGEWLAVLPTRALTTAMRSELRQLLRRHRIIPTLWIGAAFVAAGLEGPSDPSVLSPAFVGLTCYLSTALNPAFRLHSEELDHPGLWRAWPLSRSARTLAQVGVVVYVLTPGALLGGLGMWMAGTPLSIAATLMGASWAASIALTAFTLGIARWASPTPTGVALLSHSAIIGAGLLVIGS